MDKFLLKRKASSQDVPEEINWEEEIQYDPGKRKLIEHYHPNLKDLVRRKYLLNGPCQPREIDFESSDFGGKQRKFNPEWFDEFESWLEYSEEKKRAYCFPCFLFRDRSQKKEAGYEAFVVNGWKSWNMKSRLKEHVGEVQGETLKVAYFARLNAAIDTTRLLLKQGLPFRGHDESKNSHNRGNFLEVRDFLAEHDPVVRKAVGKDAAKNSLMSAPEVQKDIGEGFAHVIVQSILKEVRNNVFCLLVDESRDVSGKEQMAVALRYVDSSGDSKESFVGLVHVKETTSSYLKSSIDSLFAKYKLSYNQVRGQGYDGASNMRGQFNGLKSLIMRESSTAYYVHCFAHQLQLVVVAVVRKHKGVSNFFSMISTLLNVVGGSSKRRDMIRDINLEEMRKALGCGQLTTGTGLNQEQCLQRPGDTRWGSHAKTLKSLLHMFRSVVKVLEFVEEEDTDRTNRDQANGLLVYFQSFDFVFYLHLMLTILTTTNTLSLALQRKDQDIVNAMKCVKSTRIVLNELRENEWESMLGEVHVFCETHDIVELDMEEAYVNPKKRRQVTGITNKHHYQVDCFNDVFDWLVQELDNRFSETSTNLLVWSAALSPRDSFRDFNLENLMSLAKLYPQDFDSGELRDLDKDLRLYIADVRTDNSFFNIATITELSKKMVQTGRHIVYPLFYRLLKLVIVLPIATATVERCFSAMKLVKTCLRSRLNDDSLSDDLICYVEKEEMKKVTNAQVVEYFMARRNRTY
ncbi:zinc finger MYM-type protein 1-like isoform X2 [Triticum aestivum]|uniref:zinc finger MYM-type protein 1-like isoform X2 n=1 Tax=Triticum aestivum TaxID=4565 RepID=UPI001D0166C3|nr:zinc finger MYM-type protein 1-like isoform X2 [Triticum aestivum]